MLGRFSPIEYFQSNHFQFQTLPSALHYNRIFAPPIDRCKPANFTQRNFRNSYAYVTLCCTGISWTNNVGVIESITSTHNSIHLINRDFVCRFRANYGQFFERIFVRSWEALLLHFNLGAIDPNIIQLNNIFAIWIIVKCK